MQILYVMCGIPSSGKTTLSKKLANELNLVRLSLDEMKYTRQNKLIPHVVNALKEGKSVVVDSLYTKRQWRIDLLKAVKHIDCKCVLMCMFTTLEECINRNIGRENELPDFVIKDIYNSIEAPSLDEGWDKIIYYKGE